MTNQTPFDRLDLTTPDDLNPQFTFENFIVWDSNAKAHDAARAVADSLNPPRQDDAGGQAARVVPFRVLADLHGAPEPPCPRMNHWRKRALARRSKPRGAAHAVKRPLR